MRIEAVSHKKLRSLEAKELAQRFTVLIVVFAIALGVVALGASVVAVVWVVNYYKQPEAVFEAVPPKKIKIPPKTPEHKMNVAQHEASKPKPTFTKKLMANKPTEFALPDLPQVDLDQMLPLDPSELVSDQVSSLIGAEGLGDGMGDGMGGAGGTGGSSMSFMGIESEGNRILLIFDVSTSVVNKAEKSGIPFTEIKEQTKALVESLPPNARFGIIQFSRHCMFFKDELIVAHKNNKKIAQNWIDDKWRVGSISSTAAGVRVSYPNGIELVLTRAWKLEPDVIFLISDGSFQKTLPSAEDSTVSSGRSANVGLKDLAKLISKLQSESSIPGGVKLNFIGFGMKSDHRSEMRRIARRNGGVFKEIK